METALAVEVPETPNAADAGAVVEGDAESAPAAAEPSVAKDKIQERFDRLTRDKYDALRQADTERYQRERLEERLRSLEAKQEPVAPVNPPTEEAFGYDKAKYDHAVQEWNRQIARTEAQRIVEAERQRSSQEESARKWEAKEAEFAKSKPDYLEKSRDPSLPISPPMAEAIRESDMGPLVVYYLAEHRDTARMIAGLSPVSQAREIGRIEAALTAAASTKPVVSKAPPPPATLEGNSEAAPEKDPSKMTQTQFERWRKSFMKK